MIYKLNISDRICRLDNDILTLDKMEKGAEDIAAVLTLGKTFTLQAPDSSSTSDVLDSRKLLPDWTDAERNALLRQGLFAPATYGRIRFHHRSSQEYLTAQWINRLLQQGCPRSAIFKLFFADVYDVKTVVPSLKPIAAWVALRQDNIRDEILERDPLILIQHGDPGSLPIDVRKKLLCAYSEKYKMGDISNDYLNYHALWMFSAPGLTDTVRNVWNHYDDSHFRKNLIRLIGEGKIIACCDLVAQVAEDSDADEYSRIFAVRALKACNSKPSNSRSNHFSLICNNK